MLPSVLENESLAKYTIYKIGGPARWFFRAQTTSDISDAIAFAQERGVPWVVIGGGSNILVSDAGFEGVVIKNDIRTLHIFENILTTGAGVTYAAAAKTASDAGLTGLEWAYGIPGTIGGAIRGNAGAFGSDTASRLQSVELFDPLSGKCITKTPTELSFSYRRSLLCEKPWVVLEARFTLESADRTECQARLTAYLEQKKAGQPLGVQCAGCTFKNVPIEHIPRSFECPIEFLQKGRVPAGYLLEKANMKNHVVGRAMISPKHANFIINLGGATASDIYELIHISKAKVCNDFGVQLEEEIVYIGEF